MIHFEHVQLKNFLCYTNAELDLANRGIVRINGKNGAGKSALFESILWALFGRTPRGLDSKNIIKYGTDNASVELSLTYQNHNYIIRREVTPSKHTLIYYKDGTEHTFPSVREAQDALNQELGQISESLILQTFYLKQYDHDTFVYLTDSKQKDILEDILGMAIFDYTFKLLKDTHDQMQSLILKHEQELSRIHSLIQNVESYIALLDTQKSSLKRSAPTMKEADVRAKLDSLNTKLTEYQNKLQQILDQERQLNGIINKLVEEAQKVKSVASSDTLYILKLYTTAIQTKQCPVCQQHITDDIENRMKASIDYIRSQIYSHNVDELKTQLRDVQLKLSSLRQEEEKLRNLIGITEQEILKLEAIRREVSSHVSELERLVLRIDKQKEQLNTLRSQLVQFREQSKTSDLVSLVEMVRILMDAFGSQGIKNNIIDKYVAVLNQHLNNVLQYILPHVTAQVSTYRYTKTNQLRRKLTFQVFYNDTETTFKALSGGERKRLEIATILALQKVVEMLGRFQSNIIIFDEIFDQLDASGIEAIVEYLRTYNDKESLFLISHSPYIFTVDDIIDIDGGEIHE